VVIKRTVAALKIKYWANYFDKLFKVGITRKSGGAFPVVAFRFKVYY
jgi:hypothetical protein